MQVRSVSPGKSVRPRMRRKVSLEDRNQIVVGHLSLVKAIAIRVYENLPVHVDLDDLVHAGVLGLMDAVEKFDASKNVAFQAYAKHRIKGAILDSLRELDWASRDMRKRQKRMDAVTRDLSMKLGRTPKENELAKGMAAAARPIRWWSAHGNNFTPADNSAQTVAATINAQFGNLVHATAVNVGSTSAPDYRISLQGESVLGSTWQDTPDPAGSRSMYTLAAGSNTYSFTPAENTAATVASTINAQFASMVTATV